MKGHCIHGEFDLEKGCPQCVAERVSIEGAMEVANRTSDRLQGQHIVTQYERHVREGLIETTVAININPESAPFYFKLKDEVVRIEKWAGTSQVTNPEQEKLATNDLALIARLSKAIEERRKEYTVPLNDYLSQFNNAFKKLSEPLKGAETTTKQKILSYQKAMEEARRKAEEANAIVQAEALRKAEEIKRETGEIVEIEPEKVDLPPEATTKVRTDLGTASQTDNWKYEIIDRALIPAEYWMLDEVKLGKVVRAGLRDIPGLRIYNDPILRMRT